MATVVLAVVCCGLYPLAVYGVGQLLFRDKANGSLLVENGAVRGSRLIGQQFTGEKYFHSRPSSAGNTSLGCCTSGHSAGPAASVFLTLE